MSRSDPEIEALWASVFGGPPPITGAGEMMLEILVRYLPLAPPYGADAGYGSCPDVAALPAAEPWRETP